MKTLTFDPKYGDIREDGLTVIQEQKTEGWAELAGEICHAVNNQRQQIVWDYLDSENLVSCTSEEADEAIRRWIASVFGDPITEFDCTNRMSRSRVGVPDDIGLGEVELEMLKKFELPLLAQQVKPF
jgi:hypothetical protein